MFTREKNTMTTEKEGKIDICPTLKLTDGELLTLPKLDNMQL